MKSSVLIIFSLLFLIVLAAYLKLNQSPQKILKKAPEIQGSLSPILDEDKITQMRIENPKKELHITLSNANGAWYIEQPVYSKADDRLVEGLVTAVRIASKANKIPKEKNKSWSEYGLDKPNLKVGIETNRDTRKRALFFGDKSPVANSLFARWDREEEYFLVNEALRKAFDLSIYSLRHKLLMQTPPQHISKMHIRTAKGDYELSVHDGRWFWMEPISILGEQATDAQVVGVLKGLSELYIKEFLDDEKKTDRTIGISMLGHSIQIWGKGQDTEIVRIGDSEPTRDGVYAKRDGEETLLLVSQSHMKNFFETIEQSVSELVASRPLASANPEPSSDVKQQPAGLQPAA